MQRNRATDLTVLPDEDLAASNLAQLVVNAYTMAMSFSHDEDKAFDAAMRAWRERNPDASLEQGPPAVVAIICHNR